MLFTISQCCVITSSSYFQNLFLSSHKNTSYPLTNPSFPTPLIPWKLLLFVSLDLPSLNILYKRNHTIGDFLCLTSFTKDMF